MRRLHDFLHPDRRGAQGDPDQPSLSLDHGSHVRMSFWDVRLIEILSSAFIF